MSDSILVFVDVDILTLKSDLKPVFGIGKMVDSYNSLHVAQQAHGVVLKLMRRSDVTSTSVRRHFDVLCPLGEACRRVQLV